MLVFLINFENFGIHTYTLHSIYAYTYVFIRTSKIEP